VRDWIFRPNKKNRLINWWALDSWIDSSLYRIWARFRNKWSGYSNFVNRFHVTGFRRIINELFSEAATVGTGALLVVLNVAVYALKETNNPYWKEANKYSVTFLDRNGQEIGKRGIQYSDSVPLEEIPENLIKATLATEDRRFFDHFGIDVFGTMRAIVANAQANESVQGGSSLTQQLAKNLFLSSEKSLERKVKEAFIALWLEARLSKKEILKMYLDRAYMGGNAQGVEAASQFYFGKSVREINLAEAALLAGLYKAPTKYAPHANPAESRARTNTVLTNMVEAGFMTEGQVHSARLNPAKVVDRSDFYAPNYYLDWAFSEAQRLTEGKNEYNLIARTTVDIPLQKAAEQIMETTLEENGKAKHINSGALVSMDLDGAVRSMVGGRDYAESKFNRAVQAKRQPGSSFKTYVYLTALEGGAKPNMMVDDSTPPCAGWTPDNYHGGYQGRLSLTTALAKSLNTVAVQLSLNEKYGGRDQVLKNLHKLGLTYLKKSCSMALGDQGISVIDHTSGYATMANGGKRIKGYAITELRNGRDEVIYSRDTDEKPAEQIFNRKAVEMLNEMLGHVVSEGTGKAAILDFTTAVGKTGTSTAYRDAWFVGFTGQYVTGIWMGNDGFTPMAEVTGGSFPAKIWHDYMVIAHGNNFNIPQIPGVPLHPRQVEEQQRLAETQKDGEHSDRGQIAMNAKVPPKTKKALVGLIKVLKESKHMDENAAKGALLDGSSAAKLAADTNH
jgi:penicillin-binding protein 1A